jgi:protein-disulfide isomerase
MASDPGTNKITLWFIAGFLVLVVGGVIIAGAYNSSNSSATLTTPPGFVATTAPALTSADWTVGDATSSVTFIEYGDYECPACGEYEPIVEQLISNYGNRVLFAFRNFPLYTIHPNAGISAQAAEAAGMEGGVAAFWQMHNMLYAKQNDWVTTDPSQVVAKYFNGYAQSIGLNVATFDTDINSTQVMNKISTDVTGGNSASIDHTPTFFLNLKQIPNPTTYAQFAAVLDAALASSTAK